MDLIISHRGNLSGPNTCKENSKKSIEKALNLGLDVEIDLWYKSRVLFLGHDKPTYKVQFEWIYERKDRLWVHCKNIDCLEYFYEVENGINYFWHEKDTLTLTSNGEIWAYPDKQPIKNSIAVLPEVHGFLGLEVCKGVCTDFPEYFK